MYGYGFMSSFRPASSGVSLDPDAQAFITAASITDPTQQSAVNQLVLDLKGYSLWAKMLAVYPLVGDAATPHRYDLKSATAGISWSGGLTHNSNGVTGNGINGLGDTGININTQISQNANAFGIYIRTNVAENFTDLGAIETVGNSGIQMATRLAANGYYTRNASATLGVYSNTDSRGFFQMTRRASNEYIVSKGTSKQTISVASGTLPSFNIYLLAINFGGAGNFASSKNMAFAYIGNTHLSDTDLDNMNTAVQTFQTTLGRNV